MKRYKQSPLPFQGQKRNFVKPLENILKEEFTGKTLFVDLFGGSGLLSHTVKRVRPDARVIYNDFDNFAERLEATETTNSLLAGLRRMVTAERNKRISEVEKEAIIHFLEEREKDCIFIDWQTIGAALLFSGKTATTLAQLKKHSFYNGIPLKTYTADGYLDGLERESADYRTIYEKYRNKKNVVFLVDPPYLSTDTSSYKNCDYWKLKDYLEILNVLKGSSFFFFTSNKSSLVELCEWMDVTFRDAGFLCETKMLTHKTRINETAGYTDIMLYRE